MCISRGRETTEQAADLGRGKYECLNNFVFFGERHLRHVVKEYMAHYLEERFHQGLNGQLIRPMKAADDEANGPIQCRQRLGGMLNYYHRQAA